MQKRNVLYWLSYLLISLIIFIIIVLLLSPIENIENEVGHPITPDEDNTNSKLIIMPIPTPYQRRLLQSASMVRSLLHNYHTEKELASPLKPLNLDYHSRMFNLIFQHYESNEAGFFPIRNRNVSNLFNMVRFRNVYYKLKEYDSSNYGILNELSLRSLLDTLHMKITLEGFFVQLSVDMFQAKNDSSLPTICNDTESMDKIYNSYSDYIDANKNLRQLNPIFYVLYDQYSIERINTIVEMLLRELSTPDLLEDDQLENGEEGEDFNKQEFRIYFLLVLFMSHVLIMFLVCSTFVLFLIWYDVHQRIYCRQLIASVVRNFSPQKKCTLPAPTLVNV